MAAGDAQKQESRNKPKLADLVLIAAYVIASVRSFIACEHGLWTSWSASQTGSKAG